MPDRMPQDCASMAELRRQIDALDAELVSLLALRSRYIDRAVDLKRAEGLPANIPARVEQVVARVRDSADAQALDPDLVERLWRTLIDWSIERERRNLDDAARG